jgi:hypothetical protein
MTPFVANLRHRLGRLAHSVDAVVSYLESRRRAQLVVAVVAALVAGILSASATGAALVARARWNDGVRVLVATTALSDDRVLSPGDVRVVFLPPALAPGDALAVLPLGARLRLDVAAGTAMTASLLMDADRIDAPPGWRVVAVGPNTVAPALRTGDTVDVVALDTVVATGAVVVETRDGTAVAVAVPADVAARTATSMHMGDATLVLASRGTG